MANEIQLGIRLTADGKGLKAEVRASREEVERFAKAADAAAVPLGRTRAATESISRQLERFQRVATRAAGFGGLAFSAQAVAREILGAGLAFEKLQNTLRFATGSAAAANAEYQFIRETALKLGIDLNSAGTAFSKLAAAANGTSLAGQGVRDIFTAVAGATTVMGLSAQETNGALFAIGQMISKGTVASEELRGQLGERLPGAFQIASRAMGVSTAELGKMLEAGEVIAEDFLPKFAKALQESIGGALPVATRSANAELQRLKSAFTELNQAFAASGALGAASSLFQGLAGAIRGVTPLVGDLLSALKELLLGAAFFAGGRALAAAIALIGPAATGAASALALLNKEVLLFVGGAAVQRLSALGATAKGGLLGLALWGGLEVGEFLSRNEAIQESVEKVLDPIFRALDQSDTALLGKLQEKLERLQAGAETGAFAFDRPLAGAAQAAEVAKTEQRIAQIRRRLFGGTDQTDPGPGPVTAGGAAAQAVSQKEKELIAAIRERLNVETLASQNQGKLTQGQQFALKVMEQLRDGTLKLTDAGKIAVAADLEQLLATEKTNDALTKRDSKGRELIQSIRQQADVLSLELESQTKLTQGQELALNIMEKLRDGTLKLTDAEKVSLVTELERLLATEKRIDARADLAKRLDEERKADAKRLETQFASIDALDEEIQRQRLQNAQIGLTAAQLADLEDARLADAVAIKEQQLATLEKTGASAAEIEALKIQIEQLRELRQLRSDGASRQIAVDAAEAAKKAWQDAAADINRALTDSLFRGFESGKGFIKNFVDTLKNAFQSLVLRPVIQAIVSPVGGAVTRLLGGLGIPGFAGAATGAAGGSGGAGGGGISSLFSGGFSGITNAGFQSVGTELGSQFIADIGNFGFGDPIVASLLNLAMGNTRGAIGSLALGTLGAVVGGPIGGVIGSALGSIAGGLFGSKKIQARSTAGLSRTFDPGGNVIGQSTNFAGATQFAQDTVGALFAQFTGAAQALGAQFDAVNFSFGANTGKNSKNPQFRLGGGAGGIAFDSGSLRPSTGGETPLTEENLALASSRAILAALKGSELPQVLRGFFDSLVPEQLTKDAIDQALAFGSSLKQLSDQLDTGAAGLGDFAADFRAALNQVTGPEALAALQLFAQRVPAVTDALQGIVRGLPDALGIGALQAFQASLAVSDVNAPLDRVAAARAQLQSTLEATRNNDLAAVQAFPQVLQQFLTISRDTFASGAGFQDAFREGNAALAEVLSRQQATQEDILRDVDITIRESAQDQIAEIRKQTTALTEELRAIRTELRRAAA